MIRTASRLTLLVAAVLAAGARPAPAQIGRDTIRLPEIVITATRLPVPRAQVASAVTVLDGDRLRARGITHVLDALREVPGMAVVQSGGPGTVASLFLRGGESDYVRVLVDGVSINQPGGSVDLAGLSIDNVERIEIVRGPVSVLYGSDAVTGVVHVLTRHGAGRGTVRAGLRGGAYGTTTADLEAMGAVRALGWSLGVSRTGSDGVYDLNSRWTSRTASGALRIAALDRGEAALTVRLADSRLRYPTDFTGAPTDSNQFSDGDEQHVALEAGRPWGPRIETRVLLGWHRASLLTENAPDSPAETDGSTNRTGLERRSADLRAHVRLDSASTLTVGLAVERQDFRNALEFTGSFASGDTVDAARTDRAGYAQLLVGLGPRATVTAGARVETYRRSGAAARALHSAATYRIGFNLRVAAATRVRGTWGTAFKEPTFFEQLGGGFATGNPDLEPERARGVDLGVEQLVAGGRLALAATWFDQRFRDLVQFTFAVAPGSPNYTNIGGAEARGLELEARWQAVARTSLTARYTRLSTVVTDSGVNGSTFRAGSRLLRRPTHAASVAVEQGLGLPGSVHATALLVGDRDDLDFVNADPMTFQPRRVVLPAYVRVDVGTSVDVVRPGPGRPGLAATVRVENVLDERYAEVLYYPARGRTVLAGGRVTLGR